MSEKRDFEFIDKIISLPINNWDSLIESIGNVFNTNNAGALKILSQYIQNGYEINNASDFKQALLQEHTTKSGADLTIEIIAYYFGIDKNKMFHFKKKGSYGYGKQLAIFFLYYHNRLSREEISKLFSIKETSVRYAIKKTRKYVELPVYRKNIKEISNLLGAKTIYYKLISNKLFGNKN